MFLLSTNVRDEHNIDEWISYHIHMSDRILIWDDGSVRPVSSSHPSVEIRRRHGTKKEYMQWSVEYTVDIGAEWTLHIDGDEYLYLGGQRTNSFISTFPTHVVAIYIPWLLFGSNHLETAPDGGVVSVYTRSSALTHTVCKTLARVSHIADILNPHQYIYHTPQTPQNTIYADGRPITDFSAYQPDKCAHPTSATCCIAHYHIQSWEHFKRRRQRPRDDTGRPRRYPFSFDTIPKIFHYDSNDIIFPYIDTFYKQLTQ
jgi:hypothetical protein